MENFNQAWTNNMLAIELNNNPERLQVITLHTVIKEDTCEVFASSVIEKQRVTVIKWLQCLWITDILEKWATCIKR